MGIGSKIKKVLTDEEPRLHHGSEHRKGPGSYGNEDVPRSFNRIDKYGNNIVDPRATGGTESLPGRNSADYTYGSSSATGVGGPAAAAGVAGRHSHEIPGSQREPGLTRKGLPSQTGAIRNGDNVLRKGQQQQQQDPYWGDAERTGAAAAGPGAGVPGSFDRPGNFDSPSNMPAREINERYNNIPSGDGMGSVGAPGMQQGGRQENLGGDMPSSGMAGSGMAGNRMTGSSMAGSGMAGGMAGGMASGMPGSATGGPSGRGEYNTTPMNTSMAPGGASNLPQRPMESGNTFRDQKMNNYDTPMGGTDRGMGGIGAGAGAGAAAGLGASHMANRHQQEQELGGGKPRYGNPQYVSRLDPGSPNKMDTGTRTSMLDPYGTGQPGNDQGAGLGNEIPIRLRDDIPSGQGSGQGMTDSYGQSRNQASRNSMGTGSPAQASGGIGNMRSSETPLGQKSQMRDSGLGQGGDEDLNNNNNNRGSQYGLRLNPPEPDMGKVIGPSGEHYGPGHQGAKVFHKCYNCGVDNDISRHFRKDAVYRMG